MRNPFKNRKPVAANGDETYLTVEFYDSNVPHHLVHNAVVTAAELEQHFGKVRHTVHVTGYLPASVAEAMTAEDRGLPTPELVKPDSVNRSMWEKLDPEERAWVVKHERLHRIINRTATAEDLYAALADNK